MKKEKKIELKGALKVLGIIVLLGMVCVGSAMGYATISHNDFTWSAGGVVFNSTGLFINSTNVVDINAGQAATFVVAASDSLHPERADYVCDGINDQVETQMAINALPSGGGKIVLSDGRFVYSAPAVLNVDNVWISGSTGTQIDLDHSGGYVTCAIDIRANHTEISNINFEFTDTTVQVMPPRAILMSADMEYSNVDIHNCRFIGIKTAGTTGPSKHTTISKCIEGSAGKHWNIHNNYFCGCSWEGISIGNFAAAKYPEYTIITQNTVVGLDDRCYGGIVVEHGARHCIIANNVVRYMNDVNGYGIYVIGGDGYPGSQDIVVTGNSVFDVSLEGIYISNSIGVACTGNVVVGTAAGIAIFGKSHHILLSGNEIRKTNYGVEMREGAHDIHITGNYITGAGDGIILTNNSDISILSNDISFAKKSAVVQPWTSGDPYASSGIFIKNNIFRNTNTGDGSYSAIYKSADNICTDVIISGNVFRDMQALDTTTLATAASIGDTIITVDDVSPFSYYEAIEIGADVMYIKGIDHYTNTITIYPALANNHVLGSAVSGKATSFKPFSFGTNIICESNSWTGLNTNPTLFSKGFGNIGIDGDWFLSRTETQIFRKAISYDDVSPVAICAVWDGYAVTDVWVEVTTTFDDVGAKLKIGDGNNILGFLCSADGTNNVINLTSAGYYGVNDDQREAYLWDNVNSHRIQKVYTGDDTIDASITKTDGSQGHAVVYVKVTRIGG